MNFWYLNLLIVPSKKRRALIKNCIDSVKQDIDRQNQLLRYNYGTYNVGDTIEGTVVYRVGFIFTFRPTSTFEQERVTLGADANGISMKILLLKRNLVFELLNYEATIICSIK